MSSFTHTSFAPRTLKQQTVCIVCQRWFCKIKNPDPKSKFYDTLEKPECYFRWLGNRADSPEAQAAYLAAPYKGERGLTNGWRKPKDAKCDRCAVAAMKPEAQANSQKHYKRPHANSRPANQRCRCVNHATCNGRVGKAGESCVKCQAPPST